MNEHDIKQQKILFYLERLAPEFDRKRQEALMLYQGVSLFLSGATDDARPAPIYNVSVDEIPGIQVIGLTAPIFYRFHERNRLSLSDGKNLTWNLCDL